jgi:zinc transport system substrate-binding protein
MTSQTPTVYTTFYPTTYFAQRIGGDRINVVNPCPAGEDPAFWMPDDQTIEAYQHADVIIVNGASFEKWVDKVTLPEARIVDTAKPFRDDFIVLKDAITHTHGPSGRHSHEGIDGHTWLDPINAKTQAGEIKDALAKRFPAHKEVFEQGYAALVKDLDALGTRLTALAGKLGDQMLLCSHPAYNYIGRRYGWQLKSFHLDPESMPDDATFNAINTYLEQQPARYMLWESEPTAEIAGRMKQELGLESVVFSPCEALDSEQREAGEDFLTVMNENIDRLEEALEPEPSAEEP